MAVTCLFFCEAKASRINDSSECWQWAKAAGHQSDVVCQVKCEQVQIISAVLDREGAVRSAFSLSTAPSAFDPDMQAAVFALNGASRQFLAAIVIAVRDHAVFETYEAHQRVQVSMLGVDVEHDQVRLFSNPIACR